MEIMLFSLMVVSSINVLSEFRCHWFLMPRLWACSLCNIFRCMCNENFFDNLSSFDTGCLWVYARYFCDKNNERSGNREHGRLMKMSVNIVKLTLFLIMAILCSFIPMMVLS